MAHHSVEDKPSTTDSATAAVTLLAEFGEAIDCRTTRQIMLGGRHTLWLVAGGALDLFAVDTIETGPWQFLGRVEVGTIIVGSFREARHVLAGRPEEECVLRRLPIRELAEGLRRRGDDHGRLVDLISQAVDLGLTKLHESVRGRAPVGRQLALRPSTVVDLVAGQVAHSAGGVLWAEVERGRLAVSGVGGNREREAGDVLTLTGGDWISATSDTTLTLRATADLLGGGVLWEYLVMHHAQYLFTLDHWIARRTATDDERMAAGRMAGLGAADQADRTLRSVAQSGARPSASTAGDLVDATLEVCRIVAKAGGVPFPPSSVRLGEDSRVDPIVGITTAARIRTRPVALTGRWWRENSGPLVGYRGPERAPVALLWRLGCYELIEPGARPVRVTTTVAQEVHDGAVMFYRSLPERQVGPLRLLWFGLHGSRIDILRMLLGGLAAFGLGLTVPILNGLVLGELVPQAQTSLIIRACLAVLIVGIVSAAFTMLSSVAILRIEGRADAGLQSAVWDRLLRLPATFFARYTTGELARAAMGVNGIRTILSGVVTVAINACLLGTVNFALMLWYSVPLGLLGGGLLVTHAIIFTMLGVRQVRWQAQLIELDYALSDRVFQTLRGLPKLRVAGAESFAYARWATDFARGRELERKVQRTQNLVTSINAVYVPCCTFLLFLMLAGPAKDSLSLGQFLTFVTAFTASLAAMVQATNSLSSAGVVIPMFDKMKPVLSELPEVSVNSTVPEHLTGDIEVADVSFRYAEGTPLILDKLSLHIRAGEFVALVGPTGCGKSTLLRLLIGFNQPTSGAVRYDGANLSQLDLAEVRSQCGVVLQNSVPFSGTIMSNICGTAAYSTDEVWAAAKLAGLDQDLRKMPMGLHTLISDGAGAMSGGQRQRLMIAQALIRRPKILFFDEATSALDNETQAIVAESTKAFAATRIVIAHRLSTIMHADRVVVLSEGRIVQSGTPEELLSDEDGIFHDLVRKQIV